MAERQTSGSGASEKRSEQPQPMSIHDAIAGIFQHTIERGEAIRKATEQIELSDAKDYRLIMFFFFSRAMRDYAAIRHLWYQGFGAECWVIGRSMIEVLLQAALLRQNPAKHTTAFFEHGEVVRYAAALKTMRLIREGKTIPPPGATFLDPDSPRMVALRQQFNANKHKFEKGKHGRLSENWWCGTISNLAESVRSDPEYGQYLFDQYHFAYASGSFYVHSSEPVVVDYIVPDRKSLHMRVPEYGEEPSVPMHMTKRFLLMCIFLNEACRLGFDAELKDDWMEIDNALPH